MTPREKDEHVPLAVDFKGGWVEDNAAIRRVRIYFDQPPSPDLSSRLIAHGFCHVTKYSMPTWQRVRSECARQMAARITGVDWARAYRLDDSFGLPPDLKAVLRKVVRECAAKQPYWRRYFDASAELPPSLAAPRSVVATRRTSARSPGMRP